MAVYKNRPAKHRAVRCGSLVSFFSVLPYFTAKPQTNGIFLSIVSLYGYFTEKVSILFSK